MNGGDEKTNDLPPAYESIFGHGASSSNQQHQLPTSSNDFQNIINKYGIRDVFAKRLEQLKSFKIVYIFDDSGSMNSQLADSPLNRPNYLATRWEELKSFANISVEIASYFDQVVV